MMTDKERLAAIKMRLEKASKDSRMMTPGSEQFIEYQKAVDDLILHARRDIAFLLSLLNIEE